MSDESVLVTGASSGIGRELARIFAAAGSEPILVARREQELSDLADELYAVHGVSARVLPADLSQPGSAAAICGVLDSAGVEVDVLVNNAGFGTLGDFAESSLERQMQMMQVNMTSLVELSRRLLPGMIQRNRGGLINIASTAAFQPGPHMAVYYASKAFVLHFSEALVEELAGTALRVTCLAPGPVATEFAATAGLEDSVLFRVGVLDAREVAKAGYRGLRRGKAIVIPGLRNKLLVLALRLTPRSLVRKVVARIQT